MRCSVTFAAIAIGATVSIASQGQPVFRAGIDLLTVEASVVDRDGRPVTNLRADEFGAVVDGQARRVVSVRFLETEAAARTAAAPPIAMHVRNALGTGRIVVFVVDRDSISPNSERALLGAAGSVLDVLGPGDAAGAVSLPAGTVELTREHDRVRAALPRMTGTRGAQPMMWRDRQMSWEEALAYERQDRRVIAEVVERECYEIPMGGGLPSNRCPAQLIDAARELLMMGRGQVRQTLAGLRSLVAQLAPLRGPKQVILMSGGLPFGVDLQPDYSSFARAASDAGIVFHAINIEEFEANASARKVVSSVFGGREHSAGLGAIAADTGGAFYMGVGSAAGVFERLSAELRSFYQIGIESLPGDRAGSTKPIELAVQRPEVFVRAVRRASIPGGRAEGADPLPALLQQPTDIADLPLATAAYTMRGDDASRLRVVIATEVRDARARPPLQWAFAVLTGGNLVATSRQRLEGDAGGGIQAGTISVKLPPGEYRLRVAAVDADGRPGVTDVPLFVGLRSAAGLDFSDLMLGIADTDGRVQARSTATRGATLSGIVELLSADPALLERSKAVFEIATPGSSEPLKRYLMGARSGSAPTILLAQIQAPTADLAPGRYIASVIPHVDDKPVGRVSRLFEIAAP